MDIYTNLYIQLALCILTFIAIFIFIKTNSKTKKDIENYKEKQNQ